MNRYLIDECLSPKLVEAARDRGCDAAHVNRRGGSGLDDEFVLAIALRDDLVLVTNNAKDFRRLYKRAPPSIPG